MILIFQYLCFLRILSFVSSAFLHRSRVTKRQSCSSIFSGWCRMQDLKRHIRRGPSWLCYRLFHLQHTSVQSKDLQSMSQNVQNGEQTRMFQIFCRIFSQGLLKYLKFGNLHLIPALLICYVHFNCSHFSIETEFTFGSDIGHSKFPLQADKGEYS